MKKYEKAFESIVGLAAFLEMKGHKAYDIYKLVSERLNGIIEVAMYDTGAISHEEFIDLMERCAAEAERWHQKWNKEILDEAKDC